MRIIHELQISDRVLDFSAFEIALATIHAIRQTGRKQCMFNHARLRIRAVQNSDFAAQGTFCHQTLDLLNEPLRLLQITAGFKNTHRLTMPGVGPQILAQTFAVMRDEDIGGVQNVAMRAIVLLELDQILHLEFALEGAHVANVRAAKGINTLVIIAHSKHGALLTSHQLEPLVLQIIGVLKFVDQNVFEARLIMFAQRLVPAQQLIGAQQQFGKIDHAFALTLLLVDGIQLNEFAAVRIVRFDLAGAQTLILGAINKGHQGAWRVLLIVDIIRLEQTL